MLWLVNIIVITRYFTLLLICRSLIVYNPFMLQYRENMQSTTYSIDSMSKHSSSVFIFAQVFIFSFIFKDARLNKKSNFNKIGFHDMTDKNVNLILKKLINNCHKQIYFCMVTLFVKYWRIYNQWVYHQSEDNYKD